MSGLDFLILAMPLTPTTEGIVGERELRALRPSAYVLNPSRGPLIRQEALLAALRGGWIAGAAIDTHYQYPLPPEHPLWQFPNVILTPHISGSSLSPHFRERTWSIFLENVRRIEAGEPLLNELTQAQLSGAWSATAGAPARSHETALVHTGGSLQMPGITPRPNPETASLRLRQRSLYDAR